MTAILQLRSRSRPSWVGTSGLASVLTRWWRRSVLAGAAIDSPSVRLLPVAVLSTASRARSLTSGTLCRAPRLPGRSPSSVGSQTRFHRRLVKAGGSSSQSAFHRSMPPRGSPPPSSRFCHRESASDADSLPGPSVVSHRGRRARPTHRCAGRAPPIDFCNQNNPRARAADRPIPGLVPEVALQSPARVGRASIATDPKTRGAEERSQPRFRGPGAGRLSPFRHLSSRLLAPRASPQPAWLGHLTSWIRGEVGWIVRLHRARRARRLRIHPAGRLR